MARDDPQMKIRLPEELKHRIEASAKSWSRTMNSEIVQRLQSSFTGGGLQLPDGLLARLQEEAERNGWGLESEAIHRLVDAFQDTDPGHVTEREQRRRVAMLEETVAAHQMGLHHLGVLNQALACALLKLCREPLARQESGAVAQAVAMAEALIRGDALTFFRATVLAFQQNTDKVVHLDLSQARVELTAGDGPGAKDPAFEMPTFLRPVTAELASGNDKQGTAPPSEGTAPTLTPTRNAVGAPKTGPEPGLRVRIPFATEKMRGWIEREPLLVDPSDIPESFEVPNGLAGGISVTTQRDGTLAVKGKDVDAIKSFLLENGITKFVPMRGGVCVGLSQFGMAKVALASLLPGGSRPLRSEEP